MEVIFFLNDPLYRMRRRMTFPRGVDRWARKVPWLGHPQWPGCWECWTGARDCCSHRRHERVRDWCCGGCWRRPWRNSCPRWRPRQRRGWWRCRRRGHRCAETAAAARWSCPGRGPARSSSRRRRVSSQKALWEERTKKMNTINRLFLFSKFFHPLCLFYFLLSTFCFL